MAIYGTCVWGLSDYYVYIKDSLIGGSNAIKNWEIKVKQKTQIPTNPSKVYWSLHNTTQSPSFIQFSLSEKFRTIFNLATFCSQMSLFGWLLSYGQNQAL